MCFMSRIYGNSNLDLQPSLMPWPGKPNDRLSVHEVMEPMNDGTETQCARKSADTPCFSIHYNVRLK